MSSDDKLMFPKSGLRKSDVAGYYADVADVMSRHLYNRFLTLHRFPDGIDAEGFYQQRWTAHMPDDVGGRSAPLADGSESIRHFVLTGKKGLAYLADQATIEFHGWLSRTDKPNHPDKLVFDLDPGGGTFDTTVACARALREALSAHNLTAFVMTSGSRGLHVAAPLDRSLDFDEVRALARDLAAEVAAADAGSYTVEHRKSKRRGRLYIDTTRNAYGQTAIVPYSLRALRDAPVATPLDWREAGTGDMHPQRYRCDNIRQRLAQKDDPWRDFHRRAAKPG
jgi:bifunctional non-homologous end joining protein LigD